MRERGTGPFGTRSGGGAARLSLAPSAERGSCLTGDGGGGGAAGPLTGALTESEAAERMLALVRAHDARQRLLEQDADVRRREGITFRELAQEYVVWVAEIKDAKPSTLSGYRYLLAGPGTPRRRGSGVADGFIMAALGGKPVAAITTRNVETVLATVAAPRRKRLQDADGEVRTVERKIAPRTVNQHRQLMTAIFNRAMRPGSGQSVGERAVR